MQTASFNGFIKTIFYMIAFYYIFKFLAKLFLPVLVKKVVEKAGENFQKQQQYSKITLGTKRKARMKSYIIPQMLKNLAKPKK